MEIWSADNKIYFRDARMKGLGYTDFDEELFAKVKAVNWSVTKGRFLFSSKLQRSLHQVVMAHWYGEEAFSESRVRGFIVEHHNNEGFDCQISNLSFAPERINKSKAFTYDQDRLEVMSKMAVNFYKDFKTGRYQITIGLNKPHYIVYPEQNKAINVTALYLLYNDDFFRTLTDATTLIHEMRMYGQVKLSNLRHEELQYEEAILVELEPGKEDALFFEHEGKFAIRLGTEHAVINAIAPVQELYSNDDKKE